MSTKGIIMLEKLVARMSQLEQEIKQCVSQHHGLLGALAELKSLYNDAVAAEVLAKSAEKVIPDVEHVVNDVIEAVPVVEKVIESL